MLSLIIENRYSWASMFLLLARKFFSNRRSIGSCIATVIWCMIYDRIFIYRWHKNHETQTWLQWLLNLFPDRYRMLTRQLMTQTRLLIIRLFRSLFSYSSFSNLLRSEVHSQFWLLFTKLLELERKSSLFPALIPFKKKLWQLNF